MRCQNEMAYFVSWVGYGDEHDSWVREEDAENAADMLAEYWKRQKRPAKSILAISKTARQVWAQLDKNKELSQSQGGAGSKKRGRGSHAAGASGSVDPSSSRGKSKSKRQRNADADAEDDSDDPDADVDLTLLSSEEREVLLIKRARKKYERMADWEDVVDAVETVARTDQGRLVASVRFKDGAKFKFETPIVNRRCPQKMLALYESRLRWTPPSKDVPPVPDAVQTPAPAAPAAAATSAGAESIADQTSATGEGDGAAEAGVNGEATTQQATQQNGGTTQPDTEAATQQGHDEEMASATKQGEAEASTSGQGETSGAANEAQPVAVPSAEGEAQDGDTAGRESVGAVDPSQIISSDVTMSESVGADPRPEAVAGSGPGAGVGEQSVESAASAEAEAVL